MTTHSDMTVYTSLATPQTSGWDMMCAQIPQQGVHIRYIPFFFPNVYFIQIQTL